MSNIVLCGFMGSGKTVVGKNVAEKLGMNFVDTDEEIAKREGKSIAEIFVQNGEDYFRTLENKVLNDLLSAENTVVSLGGGIAAKKENHNTLKRIGRVILLDCGIKETLKRIKNDKTRPLAVGEKEIINLYNKRKPLYEEVADLIADSGEDINKTVQTILRVIGEI